MELLRSLIQLHALLPERSPSDQDEFLTEGYFSIHLWTERYVHPLTSIDFILQKRFWQQRNPQVSPSWWEFFNPVDLYWSIQRRKTKLLWLSEPSNIWAEPNSCYTDFKDLWTRLDPLIAVTGQAVSPKGRLKGIFLVQCKLSAIDRICGIMLITTKMILLLPLFTLIKKDKKIKVMVSQLQ